MNDTQQIMHALERTQLGETTIAHVPVATNIIQFGEGTVMVF